MGTGGHDPFFRADHLSGVQLPAFGAVGAAGLDGGLKQLYGGSLLLSVSVESHYTTFRRLFPLFFCTARAVRARKASHMPQAAAAERVSAF